MTTSPGDLPDQSLREWLGHQNLSGLTIEQAERVLGEFERRIGESERLRNWALGWNWFNTSWSERRPLNRTDEAHDLMVDVLNKTGFRGDEAVYLVFLRIIFGH